MWLTFPRLVRVLSPLPILIACAAGSAGAQQVITAQLLDHTKATSAYDAVRQLRPEMLRARESGSLLFFTPRRPAVAIDNTIVGGVEALRTIPVSEVAQIEYVNSWKAAKLYGLQLRDGIVLVTKRTGSEPALAVSDRKGSN
jgi:hypothetical protein